MADEATGTSVPQAADEIRIGNHVLRQRLIVGTANTRRSNSCASLACPADCVTVRSAATAARQQRRNILDTST